jgi:hypothetical protein
MEDFMIDESLESAVDTVPQDVTGMVPRKTASHSSAIQNDLSYTCLDIDSYLSESLKVSAIRSMTFESTYTEFDIQAPEYKVITSVLYDVSKLASASSPTCDKRDDRARGHFERAFERIMTEFPHFQTLHDKGVRVKNHKFRNFIRSTMQKTYGKLLDKALHGVS